MGLKWSYTLRRKIRDGKAAELGIPTWTLAAKALQGGDNEEALRLFDYGRDEMKRLHDAMAELIGLAAGFVAAKVGEEEVENLWRSLGAERAKRAAWHKLLTVEDRVLLAAELQRGHGCGPTEHGECTFTEEADRYVLTLDPCGSGGKMRRTGGFGVTQKAHPWSWGKAGVPYYCTHCCVFLEIRPIEAWGFPTRIHENVDQPEAPCVQIIYKKPELIPERYFERVGKKKDPSKFMLPH